MLLSAVSRSGDTVHMQAVCPLNVAQPLYQDGLLRAGWKKKCPASVFAEKRRRGKQPSQTQTSASSVNVNKLLHAQPTSTVKPDTFSLPYFDRTSKYGSLSVSPLPATLMKMTEWDCTTVTCT